MRTENELVRVVGVVVKGGCRANEGVEIPSVPRPTKRFGTFPDDLFLLSYELDSLFSGFQHLALQVARFGEAPEVLSLVQREM